MELSWKNNNVEVSKAIMLYEAYAASFAYSNINESLRQEVVQETVTRLLSSERFSDSAVFDVDVKKYGIRVFKNLIIDLSRKEGKFRYSTKDDETENKTVQNFTVKYDTAESNKDEGAFILPMPGSDPAKLAEGDNLFTVIAKVINELLATKEYSQRMFLYHAVFNDKLGLKLKDLARHVGYQDSNLSQVLSRFNIEVIGKLNSMGFNIHPN
jgi:DNA-directed RNA polymerase specialized sigma24 family protein